MKAKRLKTLGFALLGGLALLFAGCGQQAAPGGQEPPKPIQVSIGGVSPNQVVSGVVRVYVSINEDSQVQEVALYVNDVLAGKYNISTQSIRPQALSYEFRVNTAACDPAFITSSATGCSTSDNTPLFPNGTYQIKAVVKNPVETKTVTVPVILDNQDLITFTITGNSATDAAGRTWYGNGDVTVQGVIVNYTGATYTFQKVNDTTWKINRTGGQAVNSGNFLPGDNQSITGLGSGKLSSASGTSLIFAKNDNPVEVGPVGYYSSTLLSDYLLTSTQPTLRIDNLKPSSPGLGVQRLYEERRPTSAASSGTWVSKSTKLFRVGGGDGGVGIDTGSFQVTLEFGLPAQTVTKGEGADLSDLPSAPSGTFYDVTVKKLVLKDKLGNTQEVTTGLPTLRFETTPPNVSFTTPPLASAPAGTPYTVDVAFADPGTGSGVFAGRLAIKQGGTRFIYASLTSGSNTVPLFKLGDGPNNNQTLTVVVFDVAGNVRELDLNVNVLAASAVDQQAPVVNSLTASGSLTAGDPTSSVTLTAKASEKPTHTSGSVTFLFFRQHSNAGQYFVPLGVAVTSGGSSQDEATSDPIQGNDYPEPGTFGVAVLVHDGDHNANLATGALQVVP